MKIILKCQAYINGKVVISINQSSMFRSKTMISEFDLNQSTSSRFHETRILTTHFSVPAPSTF